MEWIIRATTAEQAREQFVAWLNYMIIKTYEPMMYAETIPKNKEDIIKIYGKKEAYMFAVDFFSNVKIESAG